MNNNIGLQFTELTPTDVAIHRRLYLDLLSSGDIIPKEFLPVYCTYAAEELHKARDLFRKTFKTS